MLSTRLLYVYICSASRTPADRISLLPLIILRLYYLSPLTIDASTPFPITTAGIYTQAVLELAIILASVTSAKPFLRPFHQEYFTAADSSVRGFRYLKQPGSDLDNGSEMTPQTLSSADAQMIGD